MMLRAVRPEPPEAAKPIASKPVVIPAGTRTGLNTTNSGIVAINATAVPERDKPARTKRNIAACVAKTAVKKPFNVGFECFGCFFFNNPILNYFEWLEERELASLVPMVVGVYEEAGIHVYRKWCGLRARYMLISHETMQVMNVELYVTSMPFLFVCYFCWVVTLFCLFFVL
ncbi:hypothetical protein Bca52824_006050 [Brassica carinata]|uniref:Uncharacterized protein n=1 Tax=Brassica carinata TaxID=52824 RepID=A0A8X8BH46_BRACI|nr:hypothetical protein Bca52824_006050 [Brassica carinata]